MSDVREMQSGPMPNPFGEPPLPLWRRMWKRRDSSARAPKRYSGPATGVGALMAFGVAGIHGMAHATRPLFVAVVTVLPALAVEAWWKRRSRRHAERLMIGP